MTAQVQHVESDGERSQALTLPRSHAPPDPGAPYFVWGVWALMLLGAFAYFCKFSYNLPYLDDWDWIPFLLGEQPVSFRWLWSLHNEHRLFVPRVLLVGIFRALGSDFRSGMLFQVLSLAGLAAVMILAARKQRGWTSYSDAFFPLVLLSLAHYENLLWFSQFQIVLVTVLAGILLVIVVRNGSTLTLETGILAGICLLLLPGCGAGGLAYVPSMSLYLVYAGFRSWRSADRRSGELMVLFAVAALTLVSLYFIGYHRPAHHPPSAGLWRSFEWCVHILGFGFGLILGAEWWPVPGLIVVGILLASATAVAVELYVQPEKRSRTVGLLFFLAGAASLIFGIAWGRSGIPVKEIPIPRYWTLVAPALCWAYFAWGTLKWASVGRVMQMSLFTFAAAAGLVGAHEGLNYASYRRHITEIFLSDLRDGMPPALLADRHARSHFGRNTERMAGYLPMLHRASIGPFRDLQLNPAMREVPLPLQPAFGSQMTWEGNGVGRAVGSDPYMVFVLDEPRLVYGIRLKCTYEDPEVPPVLQVYWKNRDQPDFADERSKMIELDEGQTSVELTVGVGGTIDQIRIDPDLGPCAFKIGEIVLLVPEKGK